MDYKVKPPTELWVGKHDGLLNQVCLYLEEVFGVEAGSVESRQIRERSHHAVRWVQPEKNQYRRVDLEPVFNELRFSISSGAKFFFVIEHADLLTPACANSFLKSLEEPPEGYHFILLAENKDLIIPTVLSRSVVKTFSFADCEQEIPFLEYFKKPKNLNHINFLKDFEKASLTENKTRLFLDELNNYWAAQRKTAVMNEDDKGERYAKKMHQIVVYASNYQPMAGSTKIFWRNLFLMFSV